MNKPTLFHAELLAAKVPELLGELRGKGGESWLAFVCVPVSPKRVHVWWCLAPSHDEAQAAVIEAAQRGYLGETGRFEVRTVPCKVALI